MIDYDEEDRNFVVEAAIKNNLGDPEEIKLYEEISLALELDQDKNYNVVGSGIGDGIDFSITTPYPDGLPENIGTMFFNINRSFDVNVVESQRCASVGERLFEINLKKL